MDSPHVESTTSEPPEEGSQAAGVREEEPAAPGVVVDDDDLIMSHLPIDVVARIISFLPYRDAARTQILSSRWRHVTSHPAPLSLDHRDLAWPRYDDHDVAARTTGILASRTVPTRRFSTHVVHLHRHGRRLPPSALRFSATLRLATFAKCQFPEGKPFFFPELRQLGLEDVVISEESLHGVMAGCPVLESLLLTGRSRFECIRINSRSIVSLALRVYTDELVIEDAPLLERLLQVESRVATNLSVVSAPKLETVGCLCDLDFYSKLLAPEPTVLQELSAVSFGKVVRSVKILAINIPSLSIGVLVDLMRCFPCLETLYIQTDKVTGHKNLWQDDVIKSLDIRLKTVVVRKYQGTTSQINLATLFVLNAKMLELMCTKEPNKITSSANK
ncbi:hypothetical protein HU200_021495 [Digitaria exilis]|uniref:F-box domain-containing protein n=1 Tax=Digitaria exilis TaxID=1010633 RepID=A0A835KAS9_9POAL|nr:hypothetical protein HU200_021495 [Digitaria exilis]